MEIHWITANDKWQPGAFNDDGDVLRPLYATNIRKDGTISDRPNERKPTPLISETTDGTPVDADKHDVPTEILLDNGEFKDSTQGDDADWDKTRKAWEDDPLYYFDPEDEVRPTIGRAFHLTPLDEPIGYTLTNE